MFERKPLTSPTKTCDDFICNQQHLVFIADGAYQWEVIIRRDDHPTYAHDWFSDEGSDGLGTFAQDGFFQGARGSLSYCFAGLQLTFKAIWIRRGDMHESIHGWVEHGLILFKPGGKCSRKCDSMICTFAGDHLVFTGLPLSLPIVTGSCGRRVIRVLTAGGGAGPVQAFISKACNVKRQSYRWKVCHAHKIGGECQILHLI